MIKQRVYALMLTIVMVVSIFTPMTAFAEGAMPAETVEDYNVETTTPENSDDNNDPDTEDAEITLATPTNTTLDGCEPVGIMPMSEWEGGGSVFFTRIRLTATDRNGNPIQGAVYGLYRTSDDMLVEYLTTDYYGVATSGDVPVSTDYYLLEYAAPEGYQPNPGRKDIRLTEICAPSRVDESVIYDPITGDIHVVKVDEDGNPLLGVGFYVYRENDWQIVDTIYTDQNGEADSNDLRYGWYQLYEFDTPKGFAGGGYTSVFVDEGTAEANIVNYLSRGYAYIYKTGDDGKKIQGAVFSVHKAGGEWIEDITTNSSGYAYTSNLPMGSYYLKEKNVPSPYMLDTTERPFTTTYNGQSIYFGIENKVAGSPGKLKIIKTDDSAVPVPLSGVTFGLYRSWDSKKLGELTTGQDGTVTSGDLIPGDYYIMELSGKAGYEMATGQIAFTIDGSGATVEKTVVNPKIRIFGKVKVIKKDDAGNPIPGVRFGVYCSKDNLLEEITTGQDGTATSGVLNEGSGYYLKELEGAAGYLSDGNEQYTFNITVNNVIVPVNVTNPRIAGGVKVIKTGDDEETPLPGVLFGVYRAGTEDRVAELTTGQDGTAQSSALFYGDYELRELSTVDGYERITTPIPFSISEQGVVIEIPVSNPLIMGSVRVYKVDGTDVIPFSDVTPLSTPTPLLGAVFGLYNGKGQKIGELVTDENGEATRGGLLKGNYFLKELVAPEGFVLPDEMIPFSIVEQGDIIEYTISNTQGYGTLNIVKHGEGSELLSDVVFEVYRESTGAKVETITTDADGKASIMLPLGRYFVKETATAAGYILPTGTVSFALTIDGADVELSLQNQKQPAPEDGKIKLIKKDAADDTKLLPGAVFGVFRVSDDEQAATVTTGPDGTALSPSLPAGDYYLKELASPEGYELSTGKTPVTVTTGETAEVTITNKAAAVPTTGDVRLVKAADGTGRKLPGAVFGLYRSSSDEKVAELTTGSDGTVTSPALPEGDYYLKEIKAPAGFQLSVDKVAVHIKVGETAEITVTNYPENVPTPKAKLKIVKKSDAGNALKDAVFGVYRASDDVKAAELTTGADGTALSTSLPAGDYYYRELKAPAGYQAITEKMTFTLKADETKEITVTNTSIPTDSNMGTLRVVKKAERTGKLLPDAVFGVYYASSNQKVAEIVTANDGTAYMELAPGDYYLKELKAPVSYIAETEKIPFKVKTGTEVKIEVTNTQGCGTVRLLKTDEAGKPLSGGVFALYRQDGAEVAELTTKADGTANYELPIGAYYLTERTAPVGFQQDTGRYGFIVENGKTADVKVVNKAIMGTVEIYFRHVKDGRELAPMKTYTDNVGADYIKWMRDNGYENMPIDGYTLLRTDYPSTFVLIDGKLAVTLWYDSPAIYVPKTGEMPPMLNYTFALFSWSIAAQCGSMLFRLRKRAKTAGTI